MCLSMLYFFKKKKLKNTLNDLDFIIKHGEDTCKHLHQQMPLNGINMFIYGLIERLYLSTIGLRNLVLQIDKEPRVEYSIGIILRTTILDILIALNFHKALIGKGNSTSEGGAVASEQFANEILSDGLRLTMNYFENAKGEGLITEGELKANYSDLVNRFPIFFKTYLHDGSRPDLVFAAYYSPQKLFLNVYQQKEFKELSKLYDLYQFYSKYDHYGILYFELIRQPMSKKNEYIADVVREMLFHLFSMIRALGLVNIKDDYYEGIFKEIEQYLMHRISVSTKI